MTSERGEGVTRNGAMAYLNEIKVAFAEEREKYDCFLKIMIDFKEKRIRTNDVISATMELFKGHNDLLMGFNTFLPRGYKIQLPIEGEQLSKTVVLRCECCRNFENKVKVAALLEGHTDLLNELNHFLPGASRP
ncbi:hypothetical protein RIF29_14384 [Crotalaria pallida]|uniref:Uncharacterized protein n=1 Tax=Crotalaria pallida TaxID=3830 RepID=A0AAN9FDB4_CROPI